MEVVEAVRVTSPLIRLAEVPPAGARQARPAPAQCLRLGAAEVVTEAFPPLAVQAARSLGVLPAIGVSREARALVPVKVYKAPLMRRVAQAA